MKCPNCFNEINRNLSECPYCGNVNLNTMKLPVLKRVTEEDEEEINEDKLNQDLASFLEEKGLENHFEDNTPDENPFNENNDYEESKPFVQEDDYKNDDVVASKEDNEKVDFNPFDEIDDNVSEEQHFSQVDDYKDGEVTNDEEIVLGANEENNDLGLSEEEAKKEEKILKEAEEEKEFEKKLPFRKRIISILLITVALFFIGFLVYSMATGKGNDYSKFSVTEVEIALNDYYKTSSDSKLENLLSTIDNEEQLKEAQAKSKEIISGWIDENLNKEFTSETDLNSTADKYRSVLNGVYNYKSKDKGYSLVTNEDYTALLNTIEKLKNGNVVYFKAEKFYSQKNYNDAYKELSKISSTSKGFNDAKALKKKIISEIIELLKADIDKIKDTVGNEEIRSLFSTYNELYSNVPLTTDADYQTLYNQYK